MPDLTVIVPSRGRPHVVRPLFEAFRATCTSNPMLVFSVDEDDIDMGRYVAAVGALPSWVDIAAARNLNMGQALNYAVQGALEGFAVGFMGDDHMPRTVGWDTAYIDALREMGTGMVYGDDQFQGERIPTQIAMTSDIVRALGWMTPPELAHLFIDNWWLALGRTAGCIRYLPDVVVEHRHPLHPDGPKAPMDAGYTRVNDVSSYQRDGAAYAELVRSGALAAAVEKVRALRGELVG